MTLEPTRAEWLAARDRIAPMVAGPSTARLVTTAALGPCPPEPAPEPWRARAGRVGIVVCFHGDGERIWVGFPHQRHDALSPDDAEAMGNALIERAQWLREHGGQS